MYTKDLYQVLDLEPDATLADIKKQFKVLSLKYHPDKNKNDSEEIFALISLAYSVLSNQETRREYDQMYYIEKRSQNFQNLKENFKEFKNPPILSKEQQEKEVEERHKTLFENFSEREYKSYLQMRESQKTLEPISKNYDFEEDEESEQIVESNVPSAIVPTSVSKYQDIDKVGEMYSKDSELKPYTLKINTKAFREEDIENKVSTYDKETQQYKNLPATDYSSTGDLLLDKIIL